MYVISDRADNRICRWHRRARVDDKHAVAAGERGRVAGRRGLNTPVAVNHTRPRHVHRDPIPTAVMVVRRRLVTRAQPVAQLER